MEGVEVRNYENESAMLTAWHKWVLEVDADFITGYNINEFDFPFLFNRGLTLGIGENISNLSRLLHFPVVINEFNRYTRCDPD